MFSFQNIAIEQIYIHCNINWRDVQTKNVVYKYAIEQIYINYIPNDWNVVKITPNHFQKLVDVTAITLYVRSYSFLQDSVHCMWLTSYTWFYIVFYLCQTGGKQKKHTKNTITSTNNICRMVECNSPK